MIGSAYMAIALAAFAVVNGVSFLLFRGDKVRAKRNEWRTPETHLLLAAFIGPYGAYWAMGRYRHKTRHAKFLLVPLFLMLQTGLIIFLVLHFLLHWI